VKQQHPQDASDDKSNWTRGRGEGGRGGGRGGRNSGRHHHNRNHRNNNNNNNDKHHHNHHHNHDNSSNTGGDGGWTRGKSLPVELLKPGEGTTPAQKAVVRITVEELLALRMSYVAQPLLWTEHPEFKPPEPALWTSDTRVMEIDAMHKAPRMAGDVSNNNNKGGGKRHHHHKDKNDTAPPLEECAPLEVNEDTRWKASIFNKDKNNTNTDNNDNNKDAESDEEVLKQALLVLNKLSLTKFDKLSDAFIDAGIGRNEDCLKQAISLVVRKAQGEPHFSNMYASLCLKLARTPMEALGEEGKKKGKKFKKLLLDRCQQEFEEDTAHKIARVTENITDPEEKDYHANIIKKNYLGHMRFIGELYKGDLIRIGIMLFCLYDLLGMPTDEFVTKEEGDDDKSNQTENQEIDEEKVVCFTKLMTTVGESLEQQSQAAKDSGKEQYIRQLGECWKTVESLAYKKEKKGTPPKISNRLKYMLQDLIEMRNKGWVTRRKEETAKTIEEIHKEVAKEERLARKSSAGLRHSTSSGQLSKKGSYSSSGDVRALDRSRSAADADGFVTVGGTAKSGIHRSVSSNSLRRSRSDGFQPQSWIMAGGKSKNDGGNQNKSKIKKSSSGSGGAFSLLRESSSGTADKSGKKGSNKDKRSEPAPVPDTTPPPPPPTTDAAKTYKSPRDCGKSGINVFKEFLVGGDEDDAVLSIYELVGTENEENATERGMALVESTCSTALESKAVDVDKYIILLTRCMKENKLTKKMVEGGISNLLEFLSDIAIDAPLAGSHMVKIFGSLLKKELIQFDILFSSTSDYFRMDGNAAQFAAKVMKEVGALENSSYMEVVGKLMTDDDKKSFDSPNALVKSV